MAQSQSSGAAWGGPPPVLTLPGGKAVRPWLVLGALMFGFFMSLLDATIVNVSLVNIQIKLNSDLITTSWVISAYNLVFASLLITCGRLADVLERRSRRLTIAPLFLSATSAFASCCFD